MKSPGTVLERALQRALREVMLVAPFIKAPILKRVLDSIATEVRVTCITRWRTIDLVTGVSDIEVWPIIRRRRSSQLRLHAHLHAKLYRADDEVLIGSANLTSLGLGWSPVSNFELLVPIARSETTLAEDELMSSSVEVDDAIYEAAKTLCAAVPPVEPTTIPELPLSKSLHLPKTWTPQLRTPGSLYTAYSGRGTLLTKEALKCAEADLKVIGPPQGLNKESFKSYITAFLLTTPVVRLIDSLLQSPRRFGTIRQALMRNGDLTRSEADSAWQTLMRWLLHFVGHRYAVRVPSHTEVFERIV